MQFPETYVHGNGRTVVRDRSRLLVGFAKPVEIDAVAQEVEPFGLILEDSDEKAGEIVNHTDERFWARSRDGRAIDESAVEQVSAAAAWIGAVYRDPETSGRRGLLCPLPHVLVIEFAKGHEDDDDLASRMLAENEAKSKYLGDHRYFVVREPKKDDAFRLRAQLVKDRRRVRDVQFETMPLIAPFAATPNDPLFASQWNMQRIEAEAAWDVTTGDASMVVAVIDSGCDLTHPDLAYSSQGIDLGTMMPDGSPNNFGNLTGHGTSCAGIVAARDDNGQGVAGAAGACRIMPLAINAFTDAEIAMGIRYAAMNGAGVVSMSFSAGPPPLIDAAIVDAAAADVVMCAATGNGNSLAVSYPARHPLVIACGASDQIDERKSPLSPDGETWWGSDYGPETDVVAPGVLIPTTDIQGSGVNNSPGDYVSNFNGTSSATPLVAGLAALIRSAYPTLTATEVRAIIERTTEKTGSDPYTEVSVRPNGTWNQFMGHGRINARRAIDFADVMIRDRVGDDGFEPSSGAFWQTSDIVIRPTDDDVFQPDVASQSKRLTVGQDNWMYVRVRNRGPREARNVKVTARLIAYPGTQFVYPHDWTTVDATHIAPMPVDDTFVTIPVDGEVIAKFTISAADVQTMVNANWHPCAVAEVDADNDHAFDTADLTGAPIVPRRNNLAQRNLSFASFSGSATSVTFSFVAGHVLDEAEAMEIVVDRRRIPRDVRLRLVLDDDGGDFPHVDFVGENTKTKSLRTCDDDGIVFVERTRVRTRFGCGTGILTLEKGSRFDCDDGFRRVGRVEVKGGRVALEGERRFVELEDDVVHIRIEKAPHAIYPLAIEAKLPSVLKDDPMPFDVIQRDARGHVVGGVSAVFSRES